MTYADDGTGVEGWRIWYTDEREFDSVDHRWRDLPEDGVLVLKLWYDDYASNGRQYSLTLSGDDYYFHIPDSDFFGCNCDSIEEIQERYPGAVVKRGKWTTREEFEGVREAAQSASCPR